MVGGYTPEKVALRRAIGARHTTSTARSGIARRGQAIPAQSPMPPSTLRLRPDLRTENGHLRRRRARKALLDMYGYVDRDGDGWREQPDGAPLVLRMATQSRPDHAPVRRELWKKNMDAVGVRIALRDRAVAREPEGGARRQAADVARSARARRRPTARARSSACTAARSARATSRASSCRRSTRSTTHAELLPDGPERQALFDEASKLVVAYMPYRIHVHRIYDRPRRTVARSATGGRSFRHQWWQYIEVDGAMRSAKRWPEHGARCDERCPNRSILRYTRWLREHARPRLRPDHDGRLRRASGAGRATTWRVLAVDLGLLRASQSPTPHETRAGRRDDARRALVPGRAGQLRAAGVPPRRRGACRRPSGDRVPERGDAARAASVEIALARAAAPGRRVRGGARAAWACSRGDRVCAFLPNTPQTAVAFLACASLGAVWSICSPDMGPLAVLDRFRQIEPKVLIACDGYVYGGVAHDRLRRCCASCSTSCRACATSCCCATSMPTPTRRRSPAPQRRRPRLRRAGRRRRRARAGAGCRSTIRSGSSTRAAPPGCRRRSCTATAASCSRR